MSKKVSKTTLKLNARLKCIPKYYAMNIATLEKEIQKKDKCTLEELKNNITAKQFKVKAKEEKIKKYSTMKKKNCMMHYIKLFQRMMIGLIIYIKS